MIICKQQQILLKSQIEGLIKEGYHFISYNDLVQYKEGNKKYIKNLVF